MQWIRTHLSSAHVIAMIALFVALGSTSVAAVSLTKNSVGAKQIKKNAVRASEVNRNAVGASELRSNAVASGDIANNGVGGADLADNSVGGGELSDNSVGTGEVSNDSLNRDDIVGNSLESEISPDAYARVTAAGALLPNTNPALPATSKNIVAENVTHVAATGVYCFVNLPFRPATAMIALDNATAPFNTAAESSYAATIATERGSNLNGCPAGADARVQTTKWTETAAPAFTDHPFVVWFEG